MKKILALMLAILMVIVPTMSMAAEIVTISLQHGTALQALGLGEMADAFNQLIDAIGLTTYGQGDEANMQTGFALTLNGEVAANVDLAKVGEELYAASNLLGEKAVAVTKNEINALVDAIAPDAEQAASMKEMVNGLFEGKSLTPAVDMESLLAGIDMTQAMAVIEGVMARVETAEVTEPLEGCDPAAVKMTFTVTADEMNTLVNSVAKSFLESEAMKQLIASLEQQGVKVNLTYDELKLTDDVAYEMYMDAQGELVCIKACTTIKNEGGADIAEQIVLFRLTDEEGAQSWTASVVMTQGNEEVTVAFNVAQVSEDAVSFAMSVFTQVGEESREEVMSLYGSVVSIDTVTVMTMFFSVNNNGENVGFGLNVMNVKDDSGSQTTVEILPLDASDAYITIMISAVTADDVAAIASADAVHLLTLSSEDMEAFIGNVSQTAMTQLITVLQKLPDDVLSLLMQ